MIDLQLYRVNIGNFNNSKGKSIPKGDQKGKFCSQQGNFYTQNFFSSDESKSKYPGNFINEDNNFAHVFMYLYLYFIMVICTIILLITLSLDTSSTPISMPIYYQSQLSNNYVHMFYIKWFYCILFSYVIKSFQCNNKVRNYILYKLIINNGPNILKSHRLGKLNKLCQSLIP